MSKCSRCNSVLGKPVDGWVTCGKCNLPKFVGEDQPAKSAEKDKKPVPSPTEKSEKKEAPEAKK